MPNNIFLARPSKFSVYFEEACKEFYSSRIDGSNFQSPNLLAQLSENLTFGELVNALSPDRQKSFVDGEEIVLLNKSGKVLYRKLFE